MFTKHEIHVLLLHNLSYSCVQADEKSKAYFDEIQDFNIVCFYRPDLSFSSSYTCHKVIFNNICTNHTYAIKHAGNLTA
jgi:hypothetical protein